jgi:hypothetical protein
MAKTLRHKGGSPSVPPQLLPQNRVSGQLGRFRRCFDSPGIVERTTTALLMWIPSTPPEHRLPLRMKRLDPLPEIVGGAEAAVIGAFEFDGEGERRVLGVVEELLGGALREGRKGAELVDESGGRGFELGIGHAVGRDAPFIGLPPRHPARAHDDVLGAGDADHLLQPRGPARAGDLAEPLLGQRI